MFQRSPDFTLRQLSYLIAAAEAGSVSRAASQLHLSPAAITEALNELERILGTTLTIRRKAQGLTLTPSGTRFVQAARELLAESQALAASTSAPEGAHAGPIVVACYPTLAPLVLPVLLDDFCRAHPLVELRTLDLSHDELEGRIESGEVDVAFVYDTLVPGAPNRHRLLRLPAHVLLPEAHPLAASDAIHLRHLAEENLILFDVPPSSAHTLSLFAEQGLTPRIGSRTGSFEAVRTLVGRGLGYGILVQRVANRQSYEGRPLVIREITPAVPPVGIDVIWSADRAVPDRVTALIEFTATAEWSRGAEERGESPATAPRERSSHALRRTHQP